MIAPTPPSPAWVLDADAALARAREVLRIEAAAITGLVPALNQDFVAALQMILDCPGRLVVSGMGKSGHIARKIAATMASTGTPALFMHPGEAAHGDLGMITERDVWLALSNSGESEEILALLPSIKRRHIPLLAMTGRAQSSLAQEADIHLLAAVAEEACPLGLAPTASTTAALALGDAMAVALLDARGFGREDFAFTHPGGSLGRRLLVHVRDVMHAGAALPQVGQETSVKEALLEMTAKGLGMTAVVDEQGRPLGVFTDGDLRRSLERDLNLGQTPVRQVMTARPRTIGADKLAAQAVQMMEDTKINGLLVVDGAGLLVGALNMHDLLRAGVV